MRADYGVTGKQLYDGDIPSQSVADALNLLAEQTGAIMLCPSELVLSRKSKAVSGGL